jgi:hypothetical protein
MSVTWDLLMFFAGFVTGGAAVLVGMLLARVRKDSLGDGDRFLDKLGSVGAQRFLEAVKE